ncbi:TPA: hypothetical protein ACXNW3_001160 [Clostridium botulinum]
MAKGLKIEATGLEAWNDAGQVVFNAVKDAMDDIRDDFKDVSASLTPKKTGRLEKSQYVRRYYKNLEKCYFTVSYKANNPKDGFDYAKWTHDADYSLGDISRSKKPARSRFARGSLRVGKGYMSQVPEASSEGWTEFISKNIERKLNYSLKHKSRK